MPKAAKILSKVLALIALLLGSQTSHANQIKIDSVTSEKVVVKNRQSFKKDTEKNTIFLKNNENIFSINFSTSYPNATFSYILIGLESVEHFTKNNYAYYTNLNDGEYDFYVRVNELPNLPPAKLHIIIESPFWQQWWFPPLAFLFMLIVLGFIIYLIFLYRFSQKLHLQRVRDNIASDLHDDVGATLSSISFFGEMMRSKIIKNAPKEEVLPLLDKLISTSKETIETMRGVVWTINPNNDNAIDFFQKLQSFGREMLSAKNIDFELLISDFENTKLPLDIQRNFFLFYKEVINNIAKHSKATYVKATIEALEKNAGISFKIIDNGVGFDTNEVYEGHGLKSLRKRAEELEGNLNIESAEGKGTSISLSFVLP